MRRSLSRRLDRVERSARGAACSACGLPRRNYQVQVAMHPGPCPKHVNDLKPVVPQASDWCAKCGRQLVFRIPPPERGGPSAATGA